MLNPTQCDTSQHRAILTDEAVISGNVTVILPHLVLIVCTHIRSIRPSLDDALAV